MGWHTGTATDFKNLLSIIHSTAVSDGWTSERYTTGGSTPHTDELVLKSPGFGTGYEGYVQIRTTEDSADDIFAYEMAGITSFNSASTFELQLGVSPFVYTNLWNASIKYWMSVSDRRILVIAKVSNTYHSIYLGFIDPFSSPIEFPYPMYIAGDGPSRGQFGNTDANTRSIAAPGAGGAYFREPSGLWRPVAVYGSSFAGFSVMAVGQYTIWPYMVAGNSGDLFTSTDVRFAPISKFTPIPGHTDSIPMFPAYLAAQFDRGGVIGVLEGVFWTPGALLSAEQTITIGSDTYLVSINISRSLEQPSSFYVVKEA